MEAMRNELHQSWQRCGHLRPPLELVELKAKGPAKFYPVDDGEGGGAVFTDNASAQEYLHLDEVRRMLRCTTTMELGPGWLSPKEVADLYHKCSLTVFMVRYIDSGGTILFQLGSCYERRGLACHRDISASVMRQYSKTISRAQNGWYLPLGGQTDAKNLKEAVGPAYEGLDSNITRAYRCVALLDHNVATGTAHVLRCQETPTAKPVYYIFEDSRFPTQEARFQFTGSVLDRMGTFD
ncbi:hypothetical protein CYMTET_49117 [Cymbomonas tetramitiformis]|uniref:Uncharacterized protein n=1 Tax=Cymbomonas tetramitiformis TaxID=36881 RepID=A0AAE0EU76_9CHLO|nr:hypothetical protein CYMTET_49117 [Cymbomonas tetramitiformis]